MLGSFSYSVNTANKINIEFILFAEVLHLRAGVTEGGRGFGRILGISVIFLLAVWTDNNYMVVQFWLSLCDPTLPGELNSNNCMCFMIKQKWHELLKFLALYSNLY